MQNEHFYSYRRNISLMKCASNAGFAVGIIVLITLLAFLLFPDPIINKFIKPRIIKAITESHPEYGIDIAEMNYSVINNRFEFDSVALRAVDGTFSSKVSMLTVSGISWIHLLWGEPLALNDFTNSIVNAEDIDLNFTQSQHNLRFKRLFVSVPDSEIVIESMKYFSLEDDEQFFAHSQFRQTRFRFDIPKIEVAGVGCLGMLEGNIYHAKSITMRDMFADILVNMDKPYDKKSTKPQMPNEILFSMNRKVNVSNVDIINAQLKYCERAAVNAIPGKITFNKVNISVSGISNQKTHTDSLIIYANGLFMNSGRMKLYMVIPLPSKDFSLRYSGTLTTMKVAELNSFLEPAEHRRIKSGILQSATFDIDVNSGHAGGALRVVYKDLSIAVLNKNTGSEKGIFDQISSFIGKAFIIRSANLPNNNGEMKIGKIQYKRKSDDYFLQFVWFSLRSGVGDVVGF